jgi:tetratricopeptide (TPR) repeat protein
MKEKEVLLVRLVERMFEKQQTFLLIDELYEDEIIGTYIRNIQIDSPYQQLLFEGVISQFLQGEELVVSITVENYFHHLLSLVLQKDQRFVTPESLIQLIKANNLKGVKEGVSNLLSFDVELSNFNRITELIDLSEVDEDVLGICVMPLVNALLIHGVEKTVKVILENPTENDWKLLIRLYKRLVNLELHLVINFFLTFLIPHINFKTKASLFLGLQVVQNLDKNEAIDYLSKIEASDSLIKEDEELLIELGNCEYELGNYNKAMEYFESSLLIFLKNHGDKHNSIALSYLNIAKIFESKGDYYKAIEYLEKSLIIYINNLGFEHSFVSTAYNNIGNIWNLLHNYEKAIEYYEKSLNIDLKTIGSIHPEVATTYNNIGFLFGSKKEFEDALINHKKSLDIRLKYFGENHLETAISYGNIAQIYASKGELDKAIIFQKKCLKILLKKLGPNHQYVATAYNGIGKTCDLKGDYDKAIINFEKSIRIYKKTIGENHSFVATVYNNIGNVFKKIEKYEDAIVNFEKAYLILKKGGVAFIIAICYESINKSNEALDFYIQSAEIRKEDPEVGLEAESTQKAISNALRLAKELDKEKDLPDWMKNKN